MTGDSEVHGSMQAGGKAALWIGFSAMLISTIYFTRASYHSHSKHVLYHFVTALVTMIASLAYLLSALVSQGYSGSTDITWVHYLDWVITTPMLLIDLGMLANMRVAEVVFLAVTDVVMVASGYAGVSTDDNRAIWPYFMFGMFAFFIITVRLVQKLRELSRTDPSSAESRAFKFLSVWTLMLWSFYPLLFVLTKTHTMDADTEAIVFCVLDILAKCVFGAILVGSREVLEGEHTPLALLAMAITGINPSMRRSSSSSPELQAAIAEYMKGNPLYAGKGAAASRRGSQDFGNAVAAIAAARAAAAVSPSGAATSPISDSSEEAVDLERGTGYVSRPYTSTREAVVSPGGAAFAMSPTISVTAPAALSPVAAASTPASTSALAGVLQGLLAQQQAAGGRDAAINAQVQAVLAAMAGGAPAGSTGSTGATGTSAPGSRRSSTTNGNLLAALMQNALVRNTHDIATAGSVGAGTL